MQFDSNVNMNMKPQSLDQTTFYNSFISNCGSDFPVANVVVSVASIAIDIEYVLLSIRCEIRDSAALVTLLLTT